MNRRGPLPAGLKPEQVVAVIDNREQLPLDLSPLRSVAGPRARRLAVAYHTPGGRRIGTRLDCYRAARHHGRRPRAGRAVRGKDTVHCSAPTLARIPSTHSRRARAGSDRGRNMTKDKLTYNRTAEHAAEQEQAVEKICDGLREFHNCGFEWPAVRKRVLYWLGVMQGDGADIAQMRAVADAAEKSYREKITRRKPAQTGAKKPK